MPGNKMKKLLIPLLMSSTLFSVSVLANDFSQNIQQAMQSEQRSDAEKLRDRNRKPVKTLEFFGIKGNMKVLELIPGSGWYTKLLAPALRENGQFYVSLGTSRVEKSLLKQPPFNQTKILSAATSMNYSSEKEAYQLSDINFEVNDLDAVLTFRNYHNFSQGSRMAMNKAAYKALKSGGIYGVVDHTRRHMQQDNDENGRRVDPVLAIKEIQAAGFELVNYSSLHYRADDELRYEVGRKSVTGNTDRFTLLFKKPQ